MSWDGITALSEIIAATAVVVSLLYVAAQVKQSNRQEAVSGLQKAIREFVNAFAATTANESDAQNFRNGMNQFDALSKNEKAVFHSKMQMLISGFNQVLLLHNSGMLSEDEFTAMERTFLWITLSDGGQQWWSQYKHIPPARFAIYVDRRLNEERPRITPANKDLDWFGAN